MYMYMQYHFCLSFLAQVSVAIVEILGRYRKDNCKVGRITNTDDFKHLARKVLFCFWLIIAC